MWEESDVEEAIVAHPEAVEGAVAALKLEPNVPNNISVPSMKTSAEMFGVPFEGFVVDWLKRLNLLTAFVAALESRNVTLGDDPVPDADAVDDSNVDYDALAKFIAAAKSFRCRIQKDNLIAGSGVLVGPSTVLTAWHVIASAAPGKPQPAADIRVILSDNRTVRAWPPATWESPCGDLEIKNRFPQSDAEVKDRHDVALLRLARPVGALLGTAKLPEKPAEYGRGSIMLVHYPEGQDHGLGHGTVRRMRNIKARWSHSIATLPGSSGGACFNSKLALIGIHQGRDPQDRGRLVPAHLFYDRLREFVANDQAPFRMWSLDGTPNGDYVIGRQALFEAFAAVHRNPRVRGIRIKRADAAGVLSGLQFSFQILEQLVVRNAELRLFRLSFEKLAEDVANDIARRATAAGIPVDPIPAAQGVADGQSAPEAVGADRGRRVAAMIDAKAAELGIEAWVFIDHPAIAFGDEPRSALEAFIDAAIRLEHIRLVIAGFEAVALPGQDFYAAPDPGEEGGRGLINEILTGFQSGDVRLFLSDAARSAGRQVSEQYLTDVIDEVLRGIKMVNGVYPPWAGAKVAPRLKTKVKGWFK